MVQDKKKKKKKKKKQPLWGFPRGPVLRTWHFHSSGLGSIPGRGTKILQAVGYGQTLKQKQNKKEKALHFKSKT